MSRHRRPQPSWWPLRGLLAGLAVAAGAVALVSPGQDVTAAQAGVTGTAAGTTAPVPVVTERGDVSLAAFPVRVRLPAIGVDSPLVELGTDGDGALVPPADFDRAGWFSGSPVPGAVGPSVIAGHVDSSDGPAVFFRLDDLAPGDEVLIDRADGTTVRFTVTGAERFPKTRFPTQAVYGPTPRAELRLITCGGEFDRDRRSYRDNVVVTAVLVG
ncbi:class F sortase [Blastococcus saxobsidens]|uniref:Sortase family protein n=1 Tax=Blastococcus saxobsidens TaxID=138336 RepID=A0A4Q7Y946_9ACTN|nr:class F sortase [Blastococcus saxobsidens]RZU32843.1 sortase family protein [Blastococcus saxobsidens]